MSIESWKREFYSIKAKEFAANHTQEECLDHCIKKWEGLSKENVERHWLKIDGRKIVDESGEDFHPVASNCSLCVKSSISEEDACCNKCIIKQTMGQTCSEKNRIGSDSLDPWRSWTKQENPKLMQELLAETKRKLEEKKSAEVTVDERRKKHIEDHVRLHKALDELIADWFHHVPEHGMGSTIISLAEWSNQQTIDPTED